MFKKMFFAFCISLLLSISVPKAIGEVFQSISGKVTITRDATPIKSEDIPQKVGGNLEHSFQQKLEAGTYTIKEEYTMTLVDQKEPEKFVFEWEYKVENSGNYQWSVHGEPVEALNRTSWMWLKNSVMRPIKTYSDNDISYAKAHIGGRKKDAQPATWNLPKGLPLSIDLTGDIGGSVKFSKDTTVQKEIEIPLQKETNKLEDVAVGVQIETPGTYEIQETMGLTIRALGIGEVLGLKFDFPVMVLWKYETKEAGNRSFHITGSVANISVEVKGDLEAEQYEPNPLISPGNSVQLPITVTRDIRQGETYKYSMDFSATWTKEAYIEKVGQIDVRVSAPEGTKDKIVSTDQIFTVTATVTSGNESGILKLDGGGTYKLPEGESDKKPFAINIPVSWKVQAPEKPTPPEGAKITVSITGTTISNSITVITVPKGTKKIEDFSIVEPPGAQDKEVSTEQSFIMQAKVIHEGEAKVNAQTATIDIPPGFGVKAGESITQPVPENGPKKGIVKWTITALKFETIGDFTVTAEGIEENTGEVVKTDPKTLTVTVVSKADLSVNITEPKVKGLFSTGREFTVTAEVTNKGNASVTGKGSLKIDLGETKAELLPLKKDKEEFELGKSEKTSVFWKLKAPSTKQSPMPITVSFGEMPLDENSGEPAKVSKFSEQRQIETIKPLPITITEPDGAKDGVVSTGQIFTVKAEKLPTDITKATIHFYRDDEQIFEYRADEPTKKPQPDGTVIWQIIAPPTASPKDEIKASFEGEGISISSEPLSIKTVTAASLSISAKISEPEGTRDGTVSTGQKITVEATLKKGGEARLTGSGKLSIVPPDGYKIVSGTGDFAFDAASKTEEIEKTVSWDLEAPATAKEIKNITVKIEKVPLDENTNQPANTPVQTDSVPINTVEKGGLAISRFAIAAPDGAIDRVVSTKQELTVEAIVTTTGTAKVINLKITIEAEGYKPKDPNKEPLKDRAVSPGATITWTLIAPDFPRTGELKVTVRGEEENFKTEVKAESRFTVQIVYAADLQVIKVNTLKTTGEPTEGIVKIKQQFYVTATVSNVGEADVIGSGQLKLDLRETQVKFLQGEKEEVKPFLIDVPVYWNVEAPLTEQSEQSIKVIIVDFPLDENSKKPAVVSKPSGETKVQIILGEEPVTALTIISPGAVVGVVSTGQKFSVQNSVKVPTGVKAVNSTIKVPSGYQVDVPTKEIPPDGGTVTWEVTAPSYPKPKENITITTSFDIKPPQDKNIPIQTVQGASLEVQADITAPLGAIDKTLSTRQEFEVTATLTKKGEANLVGLGKLSIEVPPTYFLLSEKTRPFSNELEAVTWKVRAPSSATDQPADIIVKIEGAPNDENTNQPAEIIKPGASRLEIKSIEEAAELEVFLDILEPQSAIGGTLQKNQIFTLSATVKNNGQAQVDDTGRLLLALPNGYKLIEGAKERVFMQEGQKEEQIQWRIQAPEKEDETPQQIEVSIEIQAIPKDKNTNQPAVVKRQTAGKAVFTTIPPPLFDFLVIETLKGTLKGTSAKEAVVSTGQIFKVKNNISTSEGVKVEKSTLTLPPNYQTEKLTQPALTDKTVEWTVTAPDNQTDFETIEVVSEGKDSSGNLVKSPPPHSAVRIKTVQKATLSLTDVKIGSPPGAQDGTVSAGQTFTVQAKVTNSGKARTIGQGELELILAWPDTTPPPRRLFSVDTPVEWQVTAPKESAAQQSITVKIEKAPNDENTEEPAFILKDSEQINITIEPAATLELTDFKMTDDKDKKIERQLDVKEQFYVSVNVNGNATLDPSDTKISLDVPYGYSVDPGTPKERSLSEIIKNNKRDIKWTVTIEWTVTAPKEPDKSPQTIRMEVSPPPSDRNTEFPLKVDMPDPIPVQTGLGALIVKLIGPDQPKKEGDPWNVSTEQTFTVYAEIQTAGGVSPEQYHLRLDLPPGFTTSEPPIKPAVKKEEYKGYCEWNVTAPSSKVSEDPVDITVTVEETGLPAEVKVRLQTKAQLSVTPPQIIKPPEATNKETVLSTDQKFSVEITVTKVGEADLEGGGTIKIEAEGYKIITTPERTFLPDDFLEVDGLKLEHQWDMIALSKPTETSSIRVTFPKLPNDDNTNEPIPKPEDKGIEIKVVQKAQVAIGQITFTPSGAADRVVSTEQTFTVHVPITVSGTAKAIDIKATLPLLSLPKGYTSLDPLERNIQIQGETVKWNVKAPKEKSDLQEFKVQASCTDENGGTSGVSETPSVTTVKRANVGVENVTVKGEGKEPGEPITQGKDLIVDVTLHNDGGATATVTGVRSDLNLLVDGKTVTNEYEVDFIKKEKIVEIRSEKSTPLSFTLKPKNPKEQTAGTININFNANNSTAWDENIGEEISVWDAKRKSASGTIEIVIPGPLAITQFDPSSEKLLKGENIELAMKIENRGETSARVTLSVPSDLVIKNEQDKDITAEFKITFKDAPKESTKELSIPVTKPTAEIIYEIEPIKDRDGEEITIRLREESEERPIARDENSMDAITPIQFEPQIPKVLVDTVPPTIKEATIEARDTFENGVLKGTDVLIIQFSEAIKEPQKVTLDDFKLPVTGDKWGVEVNVVEKIDDKTLNIELRGLEIEVDSPLPPEQWTPEQWRKAREKSQASYKLSKLDISPKGRDKIQDKAGNPADARSLDIKFIDEWGPAIYHILPPSKATVGTNFTISAHIEDIQGRFSSGIDATTIEVTVQGEGRVIPYKATEQDFRANTLQVDFPHQKLAEGTYDITIKARDRQGNEATATVKDITVRESKTIIMDLKSYPNPFDPQKPLPPSLGDGSVFIVFSLRQPASEMTLNIYDVAGELVWAAKMEQAGSMTAGIAWDGKPLLGDIVPTGVYFCELLVKNGDKEERRYWRMACRPTPKKR